MAEDKETEGQEEKEATSEDVEDKTIKPTETKTASIKESSITLKVQKVLDKVLAKLKRGKPNIIVFLMKTEGVLTILFYTNLKITDT